MNLKRKTTPSPQAERQWEALRRAVAKELDKKQRLGHYTVVWRDGKALAIGPDAPTAAGEPGVAPSGVEDGG